MHLARAAACGTRFGDHTVNGHVWRSAARFRDEADYLCVLPLVFEARNLDESLDLAEQFDAAGDPKGAAVLRQIHDDEIGHVAFGLRWLRLFTGDDGGRDGGGEDEDPGDGGFGAWASRLVAPEQAVAVRRPHPAGAAPPSRGDERGVPPTPPRGRRRGVKPSSRGEGVRRTGDPRWTQGRAPSITRGMNSFPTTLPLRAESPAAPPTAAADRLPGFDRVRAGAMLLVVLFHAALPYACGDLTGLLWTVPSAGADHGAVADPLFWVAEAVVMPLFFGMSGFFSARAGAARGGAGAFVAGRVRRVAVPLAVGVCTIVTASLLIWFLSLPLTGRMSWEDAARLKIPRHHSDLLWGPSHLWYLQYLFLWALLQVPLDAVAAAADRGENAPAARVLTWLDGVMSGPWRWAVPTVGLLVVLGTEPDVYPRLPTRLVPAHGKVPARGRLLPVRLALLAEPECAGGGRAVRGAAGDRRRGVAAVPLVLTVRGSKLDDGSDRTPALLAAVVCGAGPHRGTDLRGSSKRPAGRWATTLAAASFWVYLVHQPVVGATQLGLWFTDWPADAEFAAVAATALTVSLLTEPLSRRTRLGRLLTGRAPPAAPAPAEPLDRPLRRAA